jgi:hypothetical protein
MPGMFLFQKLLLALNAPLISTEFPVAAYHSVTRNDHRNRIGGASPRHSPGSQWAADTPGNILIAGR